MSARGSAGWLILAGALAVPGFLFYRWWNQLDAQKRAELERRVRKRAPEEVFAGARPEERLVNPIAAAVTAPAAKPDAAASSQVAASSSTETATVAAAPEAALARDPLMSPMDKVELERQRLEAERRQREVAEAALRSAQPIAKRVHRAETWRAPTLDLQGIVSTAAGDRAMVNGEPVAEGDTVAGAKVVKITSQAVVFVYKGRRFEKRVDR